MPEQPLAVTGVKVGVVPRTTPDGVERWLVVELAGRTGEGQPATYRVAVHPDNLREFLRVINGTAREEFPDLVQ